MSLEQYVKKRKFDKTPEPTSEGVKVNQKRFVIQEHHATQLHYDFRLEMPADFSSSEIVLKSWAVPKGIPEEYNEKRLAIEVEDHPVSYLDFEGVIPEGNYGSGTVKIWDKGQYQLLRRDDKVIEIILNGQKANGRYALIKTKGFGSKNSWLLTKNLPKK